MIFVQWFVQICKDRLFWLIHVENNAKFVFFVVQKADFLKKIEKIACT